uniref:Uncharacterized protein n=1 Tax=Rhizobium leguminosarum TaxID=384 RepID=A0A154ILP9_RHILE|nr:hypothetical protein A4A59_01195 [Rhizobium leguminosarum]
MRRAKAKQTTKNGCTVLTIERSVVPIPQVGFYSETFTLRSSRKMLMELVPTKSDCLSQFATEMLVHAPTSIRSLTDIKRIGATMKIPPDHDID